MTTRRTTTAGRLLLLVALLFGIVAMHTLGHPQEHEGGPQATAAQPAARHQGTPHGEPPETKAAAKTAAAAHDEQAAAPTPHAAPAPERPPSHGTGMSSTGMDPLSMCLAVLGAALTFALLRRATRPLTTATTTPTRKPTGVLDTLRPNPPPPRALLSRLSVLRI